MHHIGVGFLGLPLFEERLVLGLEVEGHCSEAGPLKVEIEVLVVLKLIVSLSSVRFATNLRRGRRLTR